MATLNNYFGHFLVNVYILGSSYIPSAATINTLPSSSSTSTRLNIFPRIDQEKGFLFHLFQQFSLGDRFPVKQIKPVYLILLALPNLIAPIFHIQLHPLIRIRIGGILFVFCKPFHFLLDGSTRLNAGFKDIPSVEILPDTSVTAFDVLMVGEYSTSDSAMYDNMVTGDQRAFGVDGGHSGQDWWAYL